MQTPEYSQTTWYEAVTSGLKQVGDSGEAILLYDQKRLTPAEMDVYPMVMATPPLLFELRYPEEERQVVIERAGLMFVRFSAPLAFELLLQQIQVKIDGAWESGNDDMISLMDQRSSLLNGAKRRSVGILVGMISLFERRPNGYTPSFSSALRPMTFLSSQNSVETSFAQGKGS